MSFYFKGVIASAGGGKFSDGVIGTDDFLAFRKEWINRTSLTASQLVAINTDGDSMFPTIPENATVLIDKSKKHRQRRSYLCDTHRRAVVCQTHPVATDRATAHQRQHHLRPHRPIKSRPRQLRH